jgi:hypothetical protein
MELKALLTDNSFTRRLAASSSVSPFLGDRKRHSSSKATVVPILDIAATRRFTADSGRLGAVAYVYVYMRMSPESS